MPDSSPPPPISCRAYARLRGVGAMAVSVAIKTGRLTAACVVRDATGHVIGISDPAIADREWDANTDLTKAPGYVKERAAARAEAVGQVAALEASRKIVRPPHEMGGDPEEGVSVATTRLKSAQADLAELKFKREAAELVLAVDVKREWAMALSQVRTKLLALPTRIAQAVPALSVDDLVLITGVVRDALEETASELSA